MFKLQAQAAVAAPTPTAAPAQKPEEKALPDNLKNLLDGLKKQGIVGGGPGPSTSSLSNLIPGLSTILGQTNSQPAAAPTYTQAPIVQPQYQQVSFIAGCDYFQFLDAATTIPISTSSVSATVCLPSSSST